jgi:hypothetical protein
MRKFLLLSCIISIVCISLSFDNKEVSTRRAFNDSLNRDRAKYVTIVSEMIKGKEKMPVDSVFKNLEVLGGFPAENLVLAMSKWSIGLGVSCGYCHNTQDWSSDQIVKKKIARKMVELGSMVNAQLKTIEGLSNRPIVNCITCHRGELKPALNISN